MATKRKTQTPAVIALQKEFYTAQRREIEDFQRGVTRARSIINPSRTDLIKSYNDSLEGDPHLQAVINSRISKAVNKKFVVKNGDTIDDNKTKLLTAAWFSQYCRYFLEHKFFGFSLIHFKEFLPNGEVKTVQLIDRKHVAVEKKQILLRTTDLSGIDITAPPFADYLLLKTLPEAELGLLQTAVPLCIIKRQAWYYWARFAEMFGIPIRIVKAPQLDDETRYQIDDWLENLGSAGYARLPVGVEFDLKMDNRTDSFKVFNELICKVDEQNAKLITAQTMSFDNGSSRSQSEVHERLFDQITRDDLADLQRDVNDSLLPFLINLGYAFAPTDRFEFTDDTKLSAKERVEVIQPFLQAGYRFDPKDVEALTGMKVEDIQTPNPNAAQANF